MWGAGNKIDNEEESNPLLRHLGLYRVSKDDLAFIQGSWSILGFLDASMDTIKERSYPLHFYYR